MLQKRKWSSFEGAFNNVVLILEEIYFALKSQNIKHCNYYDIYSILGLLDSFIVELAIYSS